MHFLQILNGKTGLIFKPNTMIINHQLEFSGTRVKYRDHEKRTYIGIWSYVFRKNLLIIAHSGVSREIRCIKVVWSLLQVAYFVYARKPWRGHAYMKACRCLRHRPM